MKTVPSDSGVSSGNLRARSTSSWMSMTALSASAGMPLGHGIAASSWTRRMMARKWNILAGLSIELL